MSGAEQDFKKILGRWDSLAIIIGIVIGVGIFRVPAEIAKYLTSPGLTILAWLIGGLICLLGAICYAELSSSFPQTGGNYIYIRESYGPWAGFLFGWTELLVIRTGSIAAISFIFAEYLQSFLSLNGSIVKLLAISIVLALSFINILSLHHGKVVQNISTVTKTLALVVIIIFGLLSKKGDISHFSIVSNSINKGVFPLFGLALIPILWTYGGWHENTFVTGETKDHKRSLPFALIIGILVITSIYVAINLVYIYLIPMREIISSNLIALDLMRILYGEGGKKILEILVIVSCLGGINATIITGSRVTYAMAKDNSIFKYIGKIDSKYATPSRAIIIHAVWTIILIIWGTFNKLLFFTGVAVWLFFSLAVAGLFVLRYKFPQIERPFKVWGYPVIPAIFILICTALFINTIVFYPVESLIGLCLMMSGIPIFIFSQKRRKKSL